MLVSLLACHPTSSPSSEDSAPSEVTDTDPNVFDPETDLEWHVVDGTDGDCGTPWPLAQHSWWSYGSPESYKTGGAFSGVELALARDDVWNLWFTISLHRDTYTLDVQSQWRIQCGGGRLLLLGLVHGSSSEADDMYVMRQSTYAASFDAPIAIGIADSKFSTAGQLWSFEYNAEPPAEAVATTFSGTVTKAGLDTIATPYGKAEATRLALATDSPMFAELLPKLLWLSESAGLVQFEGPIGDDPFVFAN